MAPGKVLGPLEGFLAPPRACGVRRSGKPSRPLGWITAPTEGAGGDPEVRPRAPDRTAHRPVGRGPGRLTDRAGPNRDRSVDRSDPQSPRSANWSHSRPCDKMTLMNIEPESRDTIGPSVSHQTLDLTGLPAPVADELR